MRIAFFMLLVLAVVCQVVDLCPDDPDKTDPGVCGCGTPDIDVDLNGRVTEEECGFEHTFMPWYVTAIILGLCVTAILLLFYVWWPRHDEEVDEDLLAEEEMEKEMEKKRKIREESQKSY